MMKSYTGGHPLESVVGDIAKERDAAIARAEAAERELAELEARLADEWRPVTEPPGKADWRSGFIVSTESEMVYYADEYSKGAWLWGDGWMKEIEGVTHWRPLPPPPAATE
jgi:hypothetical protein